MITKEQFERNAATIESYASKTLENTPLLRKAKVAYDKVDKTWIVELSFHKADNMPKYAHYIIDSKHIQGIIDGLKDFENSYKEFKKVYN